MSLLSTIFKLIINKRNKFILTNNFIENCSASTNNRITYLFRYSFNLIEFNSFISDRKHRIPFNICFFFSSNTFASYDRNVTVRGLLRVKLYVDFHFSVVDRAACVPVGMEIRLATTDASVEINWNTSHLRLLFSIYSSCSFFTFLQVVHFNILSVLAV